MCLLSSIYFYINGDNFIIHEYLSNFLFKVYWKNLNDLSKKKRRTNQKKDSFLLLPFPRNKNVGVDRTIRMMRTVSGRTQIDSILRKTFCKITTPLEVTRFELCYDGKTREIPLFWPRIEIPGRWIQRAVAFVHERFIHFSNVEERQRILGPGFLSVALTTIMYSLYLSSALYKASSVPFHRDTHACRGKW